MLHTYQRSEFPSHEKVLTFHYDILRTQGHVNYTVIPTGRVTSNCFTSHHVLGRELLLSTRVSGLWIATAFGSLMQIYNGACPMNEASTSQPIQQFPRQSFTADPVLPLRPSRSHSHSPSSCSRPACRSTRSRLSQFAVQHTTAYSTSREYTDRPLGKPQVHLPSSFGL